jgi:hypothetical protein
MGDSFAPPPNTEPIVPVGSDAFDSPIPNWRMVGQMLGSGMKDVGAAGASASAGLSSFWTKPLDTLLTWIASILAWILSKLLCIVAFLLRLVTSVDDAAAPGFDAIIRSSLEHVFQIPVGGTARKVAAGLDSNSAAQQIGQSIINALTSGIGASAGSTLQPSDSAAKTFLGKMAHMGIEGWVDGTLEEVVSLGKWKSLLELVPIMSQQLGLGRVSRRVLGPPEKIFCTDPYTWLLHLAYRPALLPEGVAVREYLRGKLTPQDLDQALGKLGHSPANIAALINANSKQLSLGDIDYLVAHGYWSSTQAIQTLQADGYDQATAQNLVNLATQKRIDIHDQRLLDAYAAAYIRGDIDQATLHAGVSGSNMPQGEQAVFEAAIVTEKQLHPRHLTIGEVERLIKAHLMSIDDLRLWMERMNYPPDEAAFLELLVLGEVQTADSAAAAKRQRAIDAANAKTAKTAAAQAKLDAAAARLQIKGITQADMEKLVMEGQRTFADYAAYLTAAGLGQPAIDALSELLHDKITASENTTVQAAGIEAQASAKHIPLASVAASVVAGQLSIDDLRSFMQHNNYADADITIELASVQAKIDAAKAKAAAAAPVPTAPVQKAISLPDLERAARLGLTTSDAYAAALTTAGYDSNSVVLMVALLQAQIQSDAAALVKEQAAAAKASAKGLSLSQMESAVIDGLLSLADFSAQLAALGFAAADADVLVGLLQVRIANANAIAQKKQAATSQLAAKGLSLAELERAVRLGVLTVPQFAQELTAAGMSPADVQLLSAIETAAQQKTALAAQKAAAAVVTLKARGISLAEEQALVKNGISTLSAYSAFLTSQGYTAADAADLTQLLSDQIDQAKAAAALHAAAQAKSAHKSISLAKEESAVVAGFVTLSDYESYLAQLGYDPTDQATLVSLLEAKLGVSVTPAAAGAIAATAGAS